MDIDREGTFITRPPVGYPFRRIADGAVFTIAASWPSGVVFEGGPICTGEDLLTDYEPKCSICQAYHMPKKPHENTTAFRLYIYRTHGREVIESDTITHCSSTPLAAMKRAMEA